MSSHTPDYETSDDIESVLKSQRATPMQPPDPRHVLLAIGGFATLLLPSILVKLGFGMGFNFVTLIVAIAWVYDALYTRLKERFKLNDTKAKEAQETPRKPPSHKEVRDQSSIVQGHVDDSRDTAPSRNNAAREARSTEVFDLDQDPNGLDESESFEMRKTETSNDKAVPEENTDEIVPAREGSQGSANHEAAKNSSTTSNAVSVRNALSLDLQCERPDLVGVMCEPSKLGSQPQPPAVASSKQKSKSNVKLPEPRPLPMKPSTGATGATGVNPGNDSGNESGSRDFVQPPKPCVPPIATYTMDPKAIAASLSTEDQPTDGSNSLLYTLPSPLPSPAPSPHLDSSPPATSPSPLLSPSAPSTFLETISELHDVGHAAIQGHPWPHDASHPSIQGRTFVAAPSAKRSSSESFRLVTYNILADGPIYALSSRHQYCPLKHRRWEQRYPRLLKEITAYDADIICLQETTMGTYRQNLGPDLQAAGYRAIHALRRPDPSYHSTAMFVRSSTFSVVHLAIVRYSEMAGLLMADHHKVTPFGDWYKAYREVAALDDVAIICQLRHRSTNEQVLVVTTHIHFNPVNPHLKTMQAWLLMEAAQSHITKWKLPEDTNVVLAGDFNSLPRKTDPDDFDPVLPKGGLVSGVYELITTGALPSHHLDHPATRVGLHGLGSLSTKLCLQSAMAIALGEEPPLTTKTADFQGTLDYIFVRMPQHVVRVLQMPFEGLHEAEAFPPIPNQTLWPSDHLALVCDVAVVPLEGEAQETVRPPTPPLEEVAQETVHSPLPEGGGRAPVRAPVRSANIAPVRSKKRDKVDKLTARNVIWGAGKAPPGANPMCVVRSRTHHKKQAELEDRSRGRVHTM